MSFPFLKPLATLHIISCVLALALRAHAAETPALIPAPALPVLQKSFPNHALVMLPTTPLSAAVAGRANIAEPADPGLPFSWDQTYLIREGEEQQRLLRGFDPDFQPLQFDVIPGDPVYLRVAEFLPNLGALNVTAREDTGGNSEIIQFRVVARGITNPFVYNVIFDIRDTNTRIRGTPSLTRSPGDFIKPGQTVRYTWSRTGSSERRPKCEALFVGKTGPATGLSQSRITEVLAIKVQPYVLGHYLMTVTPRDILGEPPRGSQSNGQVFRCTFGNQDLPPATDGMIADTFTPAVGQVVTMRPFAIDPETGQDTYSNQTYDFGDGTIVTGVSGSATHAYTKPGIYRVRCTVVDVNGLSATAEDNMIVGATSLLDKLQFQARKSIVPEESGIGELETDNVKTTFKGTGAKGGDRIVFAYNRNRFGSMSASDGGDEIVLRPAGGFEGRVERARRIVVSARGGNVALEISGGSLDRTGDPRLGRADSKGIYKNQRVALCVVPSDGSEPRVFLYNGNLEARTKGGRVGTVNFNPEDKVNVKATTKEPDPKKQELD